MPTITLRIDGMMCGGCVARVSGALEALPGANAVRVDFDNASAELVAPPEIDAEAAVAAVRAAGFGAEPLDTASDEVSDEPKHHHDGLSAVAKSWRWRAAVGIAAGTLLMTLHMGGWLHHWTWSDPLLLLALAVATAVQLTVGWGFYRGAWRALRARTATMDTLIALGSTAAYLLSVGVIVADALGVRPDTPLYLGEPASIMGLISLGHYLEAILTKRAGSAVADLLEMQPQTVTRVEHAAATTGAMTGATTGALTGITVPIDDIHAGDFVLVRPGDRVPVDGEVMRGTSTLESAHVTGEAMPVDAAPGMNVVAGASNGIGALVIRATSEGRNTSVTRLAEAVREAQSRRAGIQRLADRAAAWFTLSVIGIAVLTFLGWMLAGQTLDGVIYAVTVLVIACPCALGIATPAAVMVGVGAAGKRGVLVRSPEVFERLRDTTHLVLDKTGTLTTGRPVVLDASDDVLHTAAGLAHASSHPLARAIVGEAITRGLLPHAASDITETPGIGLTGAVNGVRVELLSPKAAAERGVAVDVGDHTCSVLLRDGQLAGRITFHDPLREGTTEFVRRQSARRTVVLLTGDHAKATRLVADACSIDDWRSEQSPQDKADAIDELVRTGARPVFVGDGVNDTPALARADAAGGVAIAAGAGLVAGEGTQAAANTAKVVLTDPSPRALASLFTIAARTRSVIAQNLVLAMLYNGLMVPVAAFGLLGMHGPLIAAGAMAISDLCVVGNALRLRWVLSQPSV